MDHIIREQLELCTGLEHSAHTDSMRAHAAMARAKIQNDPLNSSHYEEHNSDCLESICILHRLIELSCIQCMTSPTTHTTDCIYTFKYILTLYDPDDVLIDYISPETYKNVIVISLLVLCALIVFGLIVIEISELCEVAEEVDYILIQDNGVPL